MSRPRHGYLASGLARLYYRHMGEGLGVLVLHGGPDFDHGYLLPEMDRLARRYHLVHYDQRGRDRSSAGVQPEDVSIRSEVADLERLRRHFHFDPVAVLGHSWGGLLAMEYATRHPDGVSYLALMNTGPPSHEDLDATSPTGGCISPIDSGQGRDCTILNVGTGVPAHADTI